MVNLNVILLIFIVLEFISAPIHCWEIGSIKLPHHSDYQNDMNNIAQLFCATQYESALEKLKLMENTTPLDWIQVSSALCYLFNDDVDLAIPLFEKNLHLDDGHYFLALAFIKKGDMERTIHHLNQYLTSYQANYQKEALINLGIAYFFTEQYEKAKPFLKESPLYLARLYIKEGNLDCAEEILLQELKKPTEWFELMGMLRFEQGLYEKACELLEKTRTENALYYLGWSYLKLRKVDQAVTTFSQMKECEEAYLSLAQCYLIQGKDITPLFSHIESKEGKNLMRLLAGDLDFDQEMPYLQGLIAANKGFYEVAIACLTRIENPSDQIYHLLGTIHYHNSHYKEAKAAFDRLIHDYPNSPLASSALYWKAYCQHSDKQSILTQVYTRYPQSPYAAEAYFHCYSYRDYMQGERNAMKHLQGFPEKYPKDPLILNALYLIGLDYTRDRKTPEGKWIRKKNLHAAVDAFEALEQAFLRLNSPANSNDLRYQAMLERGQIYLTMANESQGAKRDIYLEFAKNSFRDITHPPLKEESAYWLAKTLIASDEDSAAIEVLNTISHGMYLDLAWVEKGYIAMKQLNWKGALHFFGQAEVTSLNTDDKLSLWIAESDCHRQLNQLDQAMLILSKVINDDAISSLRLKAMYLRSEIYEKQGRFELARKQLEATSKKNWH